MTITRDRNQKRRNIMEKTLKELAEEKLEWIQKGFPKDPCRNCMFEDDDGCNCQDRKDYRAKLQHLRDIGVYDLMYDIQEIERQRGWIVWIRKIDELEKKCSDALMQLRKTADENKNKKPEVKIYK